MECSGEGCTGAKREAERWERDRKKRREGGREGVIYIRKKMTKPNLKREKL